MMGIHPAILASSRRRRAAGFPAGAVIDFSAASLSGVLSPDDAVFPEVVPNLGTAVGDFVTASLAASMFFRTDGPNGAPYVDGLSTADSMAFDGGKASTNFLHNGSPYTVCGIVRAASLGNKLFVATRGLTGLLEGAAIYRFSSGSRVRYLLGNGFALVFTATGVSSSWPVEEWISFVATYDGDKGRIYSNGTLALTTSPASTFSTDDSSLSLTVGLGGGTQVARYLAWDSIVDLEVINAAVLATYGIGS